MHPLCIAHRGGPLVADTRLPENSLAAIVRALSLGVEALEIDIWYLHNQLWVTHDHRLGREIPGTQRLQDLSLETLENLRLANGEPLPRLQQVLALVGEQALLNIEIKNSGCAAPLVETLLEHRQATGASLESYVASSFNHQELFQLLQHLPQLRRGVLIAGLPLKYASDCQALAAYSLNTSLLNTPPELVADAHRRGLVNWVYTANHADEWRDLIASGVDGIFTDRPEALMAFRETVPSRSPSGRPE